MRLLETVEIYLLKHKRWCFSAHDSQYVYTQYCLLSNQMKRKSEYICGIRGNYGNIARYHFVTS